MEDILTDLTFTQQQIDDLARAISKSKQKSEAVREATAASASDVFCNDWDSAKSVLQALQPILSQVPGVGLFAGPAIAAVIAAGDAAKKAICTK
jgi:hypothetical protein